MAKVSLPSSSSVPTATQSDSVDREPIPQHRVSFDAVQQQQLMMQLQLQQQQNQQQNQQTPSPQQQPHLYQQHQQQQQQTQSLLGAQIVGNSNELLPPDVSTAAESFGSGNTLTDQRYIRDYPLNETPNISIGSGETSQNYSGIGTSLDAAVSGGTLSTTSPLYKLDAMLFPSSDAFAYPSQSVMDFGLHNFMSDFNGTNMVGAASSTISGGAGETALHGRQQHPDAMQFYAPSMYGKIEGQLLDPIPAYLMQPSGAPAGIDLASDMYGANSLLTLQQVQAHNAQQQQQGDINDDLTAGDFDGIISGQYQQHFQS